jgi:hypothetical protein
MATIPQFPPLSFVTRLALGAVGFLAFGAGVAAVFTTDNGGTGALLTIGALMFFFAVVANHVESFEVVGAKFHLRAAREKFAQAFEIGGNTATAKQLRQEGWDHLMQAARDYSSLRRSMAPGRQRTAALEEVVATAKKMAADHDFDRYQVINWLSGREEQRIIALALMSEDPTLRDLQPILEAARKPYSAFEEYHAMRLLEQMFGQLRTEEQDQVADVLKQKWALWFRDDQTRYRIRKEILEKWKSRSDS